MKKTVLFILMISVVFTLSSCMFIGDKTYTVALITTASGNTNRSAAQGTWEGIEAICDAEGETYRVYIPAEDTEEAYYSSAVSAINEGAKLIVFAGPRLKSAAERIISEYPAKTFLLVDCVISANGENIHTITFSEEEAGFLAGYSAVTEGYKNLGFIYDYPSDEALGYRSGFIQGAEYCAALNGINDITVLTECVNKYESDDELKNDMSSLFGDGIEIIMSYGDGIQKSLIQAANSMKGVLIGCDMDQGGRSEKYMTSASKNYSDSVKSAIASFFRIGSWSETLAGTTEHLGISDDAVYLPTNYGSFRFSSWDTYEYNKLYAKIRSGSIVVAEDVTAPNVTVITVEYK